MFDFYASGKEYLLSNGKKIIIKRAGMGYLYRLLCYYIDIEENNKNLKQISNETDIKIMANKLNKYLTISEGLKRSFSVNVEPFISIRWKKIPECDKNGLTKAILKFNTYNQGVSSAGEVHKEDLIKQHNFLLLFLMELGYTEKQASNEVSNYKACALLEARKQQRIIEMNDIRIANQGSMDDYKAYINELNGFHFRNPEEVMREYGG
jgi:hypothetical protein